MIATLNGPGRRSPHIVVAGAGAMGCLFGGLLAEGGLRVTLLARRQEQAAAIRNSGLLMLGEGGDRRIAVDATTDVAGIAAPDIVLVLCKARDTAALAAALAALWRRGREAVAISFQNGLGNEQAIAASLGDDAVLGGVTPLGATLEAPGVVRNYTALPSQIGELSGGMSPRAQQVADLFSAHGVKTQAIPDIMRQKWKKLLLNVALSATSALTRLSLGEVLAVPELAATCRRAMDEAAAVAEATGVTLPTESRYAVFDATVGSGAARNKTSMCRDVEARRPSEVGAIYGSVIRLGEQHGVPVPTLQALASVILGIEASYPPRC
jgi:2-dehydropantoate 2-reductase